MPTWNGSKNTQHNAELGNEPAIFAADSRTIAHPGLLTHIVATREREQVPYKIRQPRGGGTEAGSMQLANQGIPRTTISPPARYIQTAVGMASISDWHTRLRLVHTGLASSQRSLLRRVRTRPRESDGARCQPGDQGARFRFAVGSPGCRFDGTRAGAARIPYQLEVLERGTTDATAIQLTRAGVPVGVISIPCRYIHTPSEMVDAGDVENAVRLLLALLEKRIELE